MIPYIMTLHPGPNAAAAAKRAATYIMDRWLPDNAGGIHVLVTPKLTAKLAQFYELVNRFDHPAEIRVTIQGNVPCLEVLESTWTKP